MEINALIFKYNELYTSFTVIQNENQHLQEKNRDMVGQLEEIKLQRHQGQIIDGIKNEIMEVKTWHEHHSKKIDDLYNEMVIVKNKTTQQPTTIVYHSSSVVRKMSPLIFYKKE